MKIISFFSILLFSISCFNNNVISKPPANQMLQQGKIVVKVCSRGCYQYVIESKDNTYFPINLTEEFKTLEEISIKFEGKIMDTTTDITKTSPTDQPVYDFTCQNIELSFIERN